MNAPLRAVLIVLVAASGTAALADSQPGGYVSGALGQSHLNLDCEDTTSCRRTSTGLKVVGGYAFGNGLSAEVGYIHFGRAKASGPVLDGTFEAVWRSHAITAGAAFDAEFTKEWGMTARLGAAYVKSHVRGKFDGEEVYTDSGHSVQPYVGVGGWYAFNPNVRMELGVDFTRSKIDDAKANLRLISLGARFSF